MDRAHEIKESIFKQTYRCYRFLMSDESQVGSFNQAEEYCQSIGYHLVSIHSAFESSFLLQMAQKEFGIDATIGQFFIGLNTSDGENWSWTDGSDFGYYNWKSGQPTKGYLCAVMDTQNGQWEAYKCSTASFFVCAGDSHTVTPQSCPEANRTFFGDLAVVFENIDYKLQATLDITTYIQYSMFSYAGNSYQLGYDKFDNRATQLALVPYPKTELFQLFDPMVYGFFLSEIKTFREDYEMVKTIMIANSLKANNYTILTISFESDQDLSGLASDPSMAFKISSRDDYDPVSKQIGQILCKNEN
ncbi:hypothetical protein WR25_01433 [Diploscapter pachys]|uniref:C-type lectin domain-containing protein n=1 Tax=Diploscapter pachys TaxID=2018661 RepID=A0A2A2JPL4_9BILA|nr:hypothetical protein WR25_01433 [Diploscapter pachys]